MGLRRSTATSHEPSATSQPGTGPLRFPALPGGKPSASAMLHQCLETADVLSARTLEVLQHVPNELHGRVQEIHRSSSAITRQLHAAIDDCHEPSAIDQHGEPCLTIALDLLDEVEAQLKRAIPRLDVEFNSFRVNAIKGAIEKPLRALREKIEEVQS
ncbi:MAG: hypothetical protein IT445_00060 [Phycisphaeraceae bacterium]|nr:hypothetical protein [Phycisphaeraceae bacterium]